jgi:hypothetical protein
MFRTSWFIWVPSAAMAAKTFYFSSPAIAGEVAAKPTERASFKRNVCGAPPASP